MQKRKDKSLPPRRPTYDDNDYVFGSSSSAAPVDAPAEGSLFAKSQRKLKDFFVGFWNLTKDAVGGLWNGIKTVAQFMARNWKTISAILLAAAIGAGIAALIVFAFPAVIPAIAALTLTLPLIGTIAPFAFLATLGTVAATAVIGAVTGVVAFAGLELFHAAVAVTNLIDRAFQWLGGNSKDDQKTIKIRNLKAENRQLRSENDELTEECKVAHSYNAVLLNKKGSQSSRREKESSRREKEGDNQSYGGIFAETDENHNSNNEENTACLELK